LSFNGVDNAVLIGGTPILPPWMAEFWVNRKDATDYSASLLGDASTALKLEQFNFTRQVGFTQFGFADYRWPLTLQRFADPSSVAVWVHGNGSTVTLSRQN
jgi:hypothetical protein